MPLKDDVWPKFLRENAIRVFDLTPEPSRSPPSRYPFPIPFGWFQVGYPEDFPAGQPKPLFYFDRHLVPGATTTAQLHVQDAFCPHLGAHLGHGGTVDGCEIVCPFHGWQFDAEGNNTDIPYCERTNRRARVRTYPTVERNGFDLRLVPPRTTKTRCGRSREVPEFNGDPEFHGPNPHRAHRRRGLAGDGARTASTRPTSATCTTPPRCRRSSRYETDGLRSPTCSPRRSSPRPAAWWRAASTATADGPGVSIVRFTGIVDT